MPTKGCFRTKRKGPTDVRFWTNQRETRTKHGEGVAREIWSQGKKRKGKEKNLGEGEVQSWENTVSKSFLPGGVRHKQVGKCETERERENRVSRKKDPS